MTFKPTVTVAPGDSSKGQTCAACLKTIRKGDERMTETFTWPDGEIRRFHFHPSCSGDSTETLAVSIAIYQKQEGK